MSDYIGRVSHFRFERDGDTLVASSSRDSGFEETYAWPKPDGEVTTAYLYENYYMDLRKSYKEFHN